MKLGDDFAARDAVRADFYDAARRSSRARRLNVNDDEFRLVQTGRARIVFDETNESPRARAVKAQARIVFDNFFDQRTGDCGVQIFKVECLARDVNRGCAARARAQKFNDRRDERRVGN